MLGFLFVENSRKYSDIFFILRMDSTLGMEKNIPIFHFLDGPSIKRRPID